MLPRLISPDFGLLDDGRTLQTARQVLEGNLDLWDLGLGRFRPMYWAYWALNYSLFDTSPRGYFVANTLLLAANTLLIMSLARRVGMAQPWTILAGLLFASSSPVVENLYTLSKAEPLQLLLLQLSLLAMTWKGDHREPRSFLAPTGLAAICLVLAALTKETTVVMVPISLAIAGLTFTARGKSVAHQTAFRLAVRYAVLSAIAVAILLAADWITAGPVELEAGYLSRFEFSTERIASSAVRWSAWLLRDFVYFVAILFLLALSRRAIRSSGGGLLLGAGLVWSAAWIAVYLPWLFVVNYYLLPVAASVAVVSAAGIGWASQGLGSLNERRGLKLAIMAGGAVLWLSTLANGYADARVQLIVDDENAGLVKHMANETPEGAVVTLGLKSYSEYVPQTEFLLQEVHRRSDISVNYLGSGEVPESGQVEDRYLALPDIRNLPLLTVRTGLYAPEVELLNRELPSLAREVGISEYRSIRSQRLLFFDFARLACPAVRQVLSTVSIVTDLALSMRRFCESGGFLDRSSFSYGWQLYKVEPDLLLDYERPG